MVCLLSAYQNSGGPAHGPRTKFSAGPGSGLFGKWRRRGERFAAERKRAARLDGPAARIFARRWRPKPSGGAKCARRPDGLPARERSGAPMPPAGTADRVSG